MTDFLLASDLHFHNWTQFSSYDANGTNTRLSQIIAQMTAMIALNPTCRTLYVAGDVFHVRGNISPTVLNPVIDFFHRVVKMGYTVRIIPGNHDLEGHNSEWLSSAVSALGYVGCEIVQDFKVFPDDSVTMVAWCKDLKDLMNMIPQKPTQHLIIHAPMNSVIKGIPENGLNPEDLSKLGYRNVFVGHYHNHKEFWYPNGSTVQSIGALTHQTWGDIDSLAGYIRVKKGIPEHVESTTPKFVEYKDGLDLPSAAARYKNNYVRVDLDSATESEVNDIKRLITQDYEAAGCVVRVTPNTTTGLRSATVSSGASMEQSIKEWIDINIKDTDDAVLDECLSVLRHVS